ncbi:hypothetical protein FRC08_016419, partial [Ceratobasidium sp. 394]
MASGLLGVTCAPGALLNGMWSQLTRISALSSLRPSLGVIPSSTVLFLGCPEYCKAFDGTVSQTWR